MDFEKTFIAERSIFGALMEQVNIATMKRNPLWSGFLSETEEVFFLLVEKAETKIGAEKLNRVIEAPDQSGATVLHIVSVL